MSGFTENQTPTENALVAAPAAAESTERATHFVINEVLRQLGTPRALYRVTATNLWKNHYRVNVYCMGDPSRAVRPVIMTDSFFVDVTADGIVSDPPITPRYVPGNRVPTTAV